MPTLLSAEAAAERLGVSRSTLYAYVSRGLVRSQAVPGTRRREYLADDIERLVQRRAARRDPSSVAREALDIHGMPVLGSGLTLIADGQLRYRGHDALALAKTHTLEQVAELLWGAPLPEVELPRLRAATRRRLAQLPFTERCHAYLAQVGADDPAAHHLEPAMIRRVGLQILRGLAAVAVDADPEAGASVAEQLAARWGLGSRARRRVEAALILSADHGLNVSAFTARCVASAGASPYMVVTAALAALAGHKHGGHTMRVAELLDERGEAEEIVVERLRLGRGIPGFGHSLYSEGDPRGRALMQLCTNAASARARAFVGVCDQLLGIAPNADYGLVALARSLELPADAPLVMFALGRCVGWIAHALEQYASDQLIRPRARYTGPT
ncbi:helix-turn-helix domain-containing protein [Pseudenhygromyxa sp. WMMC2535]|uniref:citrate/2-methylcitrate synthase n=1 Tax=Pseudenhygromyxa sp. WMMC2535 TaxID=2712867 RepID=UPI00155461EB|nr:citrate/2-methylcitrate synthase [Pseudenhygromyxa sp. WMMC2535]NVB37391.1 helix-turn-helix domain-containing protein [Pseudenhygromyxa sp. WMMC2535]